MTTRKAALPALALLAALGTAALGSLPVEPALAQAQTAPDQQAQPGERHHTEHSASRHIEGRIAYLKAELKITGAQQAQFDRVAQAMRDNAQAMDQSKQQWRAGRDQTKSAVDRLEARTQFAALRAQSSQRLLDAFKPLYASLSDDQKKAADDMLSHHGHHEHGHGRF